MHGFLVILPVVLVMAAGRMLARRGVVSPEAFTQINKAIYWTAIPALILRMTSMADMSALADRNMVVAVYLSFLAAPPAAWLIGKLAGQERRRTASSTLMLIRSNTVFVGLPVVTVAVGLQGVEVLSLYLAFTFIGYQIISISWAQLALSGGVSWNTVKGTLKSMAKNPLVLSSVRQAGGSVYTAGKAN
jgi:predicted permease